MMETMALALHAQANMQKAALDAAEQKSLLEETAQAKQCPVCTSCPWLELRGCAVCGMTTEAKRLEEEASQQTPVEESCTSGGEVKGSQQRDKYEGKG